MGGGQDGAHWGGQHGCAQVPGRGGGPHIRGLLQGLLQVIGYTDPHGCTMPVI